MIDKMTKYSFILLSGEKENFLKELQGLGLMDITRSVKPVDQQSSDILAKADECQKAIHFLESFEAPEGVTAAPEETEKPLEDAEELNRALTEKNQKLSEAKAELLKRQPWGEFDEKKLEAIEASGLKVRFYKVSSKKFNPSWADSYELQKISESDGTT
jgi:V/A-type H+-transporting ATPase subunit I